MKQSMQVLTSSDTQEWYTPPNIIKLVRLVMGGIDLDPASHPTPQKWIQALSVFYEGSNALEVAWVGRVFMNPPYGKTGLRSNQDLWMVKLLSEIWFGRVSQAIALTKTVPGYNWWDKLFDDMWPGPVCITRGRIEFISSDGVKRGKSKVASSFWYYGPNEDKFGEVFGQIGRVIERSDVG